jgi:hypothetical protein
VGWSVWKAWGRVAKRVFPCLQGTGLGRGFEISIEP